MRYYDLTESTIPPVFRNELTVPVWCLSWTIDYVHDICIDVEMGRESQVYNKIPEVIDTLKNLIYFEHEGEKGYYQIGYNTETFKISDSNDSIIMEYTDINPDNETSGFVNEEVVIPFKELVLAMKAISNVDEQELFKDVNKVTVRNYDTGSEISIDI